MAECHFVFLIIAFLCALMVSNLQEFPIETLVVYDVIILVVAVILRLLFNAFYNKMYFDQYPLVNKENPVVENPPNTEQQLARNEEEHEGGESEETSPNARQSKPMEQTKQH